MWWLTGRSFHWPIGRWTYIKWDYLGRLTPVCLRTSHDCFVRQDRHLRGTGTGTGSVFLCVNESSIYEDEVRALHSSSPYPHSPSPPDSFFPDNLSRISLASSYSKGWNLFRTARRGMSSYMLITCRTMVMTTMMIVFLSFFFFFVFSGRRLERWRGRTRSCYWKTATW